MNNKLQLVVHSEVLQRFHFALEGSVLEKCPGEEDPLRKQTCIIELHGLGNQKRFFSLPFNLKELWILICLYLSGN